MGCVAHTVRMLWDYRIINRTFNMWTAVRIVFCSTRRDIESFKTHMTIILCTVLTRFINVLQCSKRLLVGTINFCAVWPQLLKVPDGRIRKIDNVSKILKNKIRDEDKDDCLLFLSGGFGSF